MSDLLDDLLKTSLDGAIARVLIGLHWTVVVAEVDGKKRCGLASTLRWAHGHKGQPDMPQAGQLAGQPGSTLAMLARSDQLTQASVGVAAINAYPAKTLSSLVFL